MEATSPPSRRELLQALSAQRASSLSTLPLNNQDVHGNTPLKLSKLLATCPKCGRSVGVSRFAPHLEKCQSRSTPVKGATFFAQEDFSSQQEEEEVLDWSLRTPMMRVPTPTAELLRETAARAPPQGWPCWSCLKSAGNTDASTVMCDGCSHVYHLTCLTPRLSELPIGPWFCRRCAGRLVTQDLASEVQREPRLQRGMSALEKTARGRCAATFDIVSYGCDWCDQDIAPGSVRTRCLTCGEFDLCEKCALLAKSGRDKDGAPRPAEDPQVGHHASHVVVALRVPPS